MLEKVFLLETFISSLDISGSDMATHFAFNAFRGQLRKNYDYVLEKHSLCLVAMSVWRQSLHSGRFLLK